MRMVTWICVVVAMAVCTVCAGNLDSPAGPGDAGSAMYTIEDVYNRLDAGTPGAKRTGAFAEPVAGPGSSGHTVDEIMAKTPATNANAATASDVLIGKVFWGLQSGAWGQQSGTVPAGANLNGADGALQITITDGLYSGSKTATASDADLVTGNIKAGANIFGVDGSVVESSGDATVGLVLTGATFSKTGAAGLTGTMPNIGQQNVTPGITAQTITQGYHDGTGEVAGDADLVTGNIRAGVNIFGVAGKTEVVDTTSGDAVAGDILTGKKAWVDGSEVTGTASISANPAPVAKTGQTTSYATGDDGDLEPGAAWPSPRFTDNGNGTVTDNLTGLIWLKDADAGDGTETWANALSLCNSLAHGQQGLTDGSSAGDWRLPTVQELQSLIDYGRFSPALPSGHPFAGVQSPYYWSSTTYANGTGNAWLVGLGYGHVSYASKAGTSYVWPVRGGE